LTTDDEILAWTADLIGRAIRRQFWSVFLDNDGRVALVMPMDDHPALPDDDISPLGESLAMVVASVGAAAVLFVWERPLAELATSTDIAWARAVAEVCRREGVTVRGQLISHRRGVRWFAPREFE
jgi:hypothetical protein